MFMIICYYTVICALSRYLSTLYSIQYPLYNYVLTHSLTICIGLSAANIVGIDWRLDYSVRSKHGGQENTPLFLLCLKLKEPNDSNVIRNVEMIATQDELQDMLAKVKDAVKQVERVVVDNSMS